MMKTHHNMCHLFQWRCSVTSLKLLLRTSVTTSHVACNVTWHYILWGDCKSFSVQWWMVYLVMYFAVYLQASPVACMERVKARNREEESCVPMVSSLVTVLPTGAVSFYILASMNVSGRIWICLINTLLMMAIVCVVQGLSGESAWVAWRLADSAHKILVPCSCTCKPHNYLPIDLL